MDWKNKNVLICGGAGMIGSHLARRLVNLDAKVTVVDDLSSGSRKNIADMKRIHFLRWDLRSLHNCEIATINRDCVFQLAADMGGIGYITSIGANIMQNSARINLNVLDACRRNQTPLLFYSSSACVYPEYRQLDANVIPLKEEDAYPAQPDQYYGWEKLFTEKLCEAYIRDYKMNVRVGRFHNIYGDGFTSFDLTKAKAPCKMILGAIHGKIEIWRDGEQTRSFLYVEDCINAILALMASDVMVPINIGTDRLVSMNELGQLVVQASGRSDIEIIHLPDRPQGVRGRNADLTFVRQKLSWEPKVSLEQGLKQVYKWAVEHYNELEGLQ